MFTSKKLHCSVILSVVFSTFDHPFNFPGRKPSGECEFFPISTHYE